MIVLIDPGHGGMKDGKYTTAPAKMHTLPDGTVMYEGVYNRYIAKALQQYLSSRMVVSKILIDSEEDFSLNTRAREANRYNNAILVSIHNNASPTHTARGFEVWTTVGQNNSDKLATEIFKAVFKTFNTMKMRVDQRDGDPDQEKNWYIIKQSKHPAVLVECAFFDNEEDAALLQDAAWRSQMAAAIGEGIISYINKAA